MKGFTAVAFGALMLTVIAYQCVRLATADTTTPEIRNELDCEATAEDRLPDFYWTTEAPREYVARATLDRLPATARWIRLVGVLRVRIEQSLPTSRWFVLAKATRDRERRRPGVFLNLGGLLPPGMAYFATQYRDFVDRCAVVEGMFAPAPDWWTGEIRGDMTEVQSLAVWAEPRETAAPPMPAPPPGPPWVEPKGIDGRSSGRPN
jgi:hypothetical protein